MTDFEALLACYRSGQVSERQWQEHLRDREFREWVEEEAAVPDRVIMVRESEWREMREALRDCIEALGNSHPGADDYWRACDRAEDALAKAEGDDNG